VEGGGRWISVEIPPSQDHEAIYVGVNRLMKIPDVSGHDEKEEEENATMKPTLAVAQVTRGRCYHE